MTAFVEWVLGSSRSATLAFVETETDAQTGALFARNPSNVLFGSRVAFADMRGAQCDWTGDRCEFVGRNRTLAESGCVSERVAAVEQGWRGLGSLRRNAHQAGIAAGSVAEVVFFLGEAATREDARAAIIAIRAADLDALEAEIARAWDETLSAIEVETPDRAMDLMLNGWLLYQTLTLPGLGALGVLSSKRRLRFSRPIAGRDGSRRRPA